MIKRDCSVIFTVVASSNVNCALDLAVDIVSFISIPVFTALGIDFLFLIISVGPVCSVTLPTPPKLVRLIDSNTVAIAS